MASRSHSDRPLSPTPSQLPPVPSSPTYSVASTANPILSSYNLPLPPPPPPQARAHAVLSKADLEASQQAYIDLMTSAKAYRMALSSLSTAASTFGTALESCARLKEARAEAIGPVAGAGLSNSFTPKGSCTADTLLAASGVHHLIANHQQILSEAVYRAFEVPLLDELDAWRRRMDEEEESYQATAKAQSREIRRLEKEGLRLHRQRKRDVAKFRNHLVELTTKLDGLTTLHGQHARTLLRESQDTSVRIVDASCSIVRAEVDIFESLARKGWSGGGLEDLLEKGADLFASEDDRIHGHGGPSGAGVGSSSGAGARGAGDASKLFSILPPKSILADAGSEPGMHRPSGHDRADSLLVDGERFQSLSGVAAAMGVTSRDHSPRGRGDADSVFSFNQSRGVRPFSPQPIRRHPTEVILNSDGLGIGEDEDLATKDSGIKPETVPELALQEDEEHHVPEAESPEQQAWSAPNNEEGDDVGDHDPWRNEGSRKTEREKGKAAALLPDHPDSPPDSSGLDDSDRDRGWTKIGSSSARQKQQQDAQGEAEQT